MRRVESSLHEWSNVVAAGAVGLLLVLWELVALRDPAISFLISQPTAIFVALSTMVMSGELPEDFAVTAAEVLVGTLLGTTVGSAAGLALWLSLTATRIASPFVGLAANFPVFALAPAAIVWLGIGMGLKIFLAAFATFFVSLSLATKGAGDAFAAYGTVFDGFGASRWDVYRKVIVPGAIESVLNAARVSIGLGILGAFIGEFLASDRGLGHSIVRSSGLYQIDRVFAAAISIVVLGIIFNRIAFEVEKHKVMVARLCGIPRHLTARTERTRPRVRLPQD